MSTNTTGQAKRQKTDDSSAVEHNRKNASPPTCTDISLALCRIDDTDKYSDIEINKALNDLYMWREPINNSSNNIVRTSKEFLELGGIPRILNFIQGNTNNVGFMLLASKVISMFLFSGPEDEYLENSSKMAQQFVEREGVERTILIINEKYTGKMDTDQLITLEHMFSYFCGIIYNMNQKNMLDIDTFLPVVDAGISIMAFLSNISTHHAAVFLTQRRILLFFGRFVNYNAEMIDVDNFHEKNIIHKCIRALKNPVDHSWNYNKEVWGNTSWFFYECCKENNKILSREGDYEVIIPFCIQFIRVDPDYSYKKWVFDVLRKASNTIGKKKMITSSKGLLEVLGTVADCDNDVCNSVRDDAIAVIKHLFDES